MPRTPHRNLPFPAVHSRGTTDRLEVSLLQHYLSDILGYESSSCVLQMNSVKNNKAVDSFVANTAKSAANLLQKHAPDLLRPPLQCMLQHHSISAASPCLTDESIWW